MGLSFTRVRNALALAMLTGVLFAAHHATAASTNVTVTATVPSASWVDADACGSGSPRTFAIGTVLPGQSKVATSDCSVKFGASNDTAMLKAYQQDGAGQAMFVGGTLTGALDTGFDTDGKNSWSIAAADDESWDVVPLDGGDVLMVGTCVSPGPVYDFCAIQVKPDGTLNTSFSGDGKETWNISGAQDYGTAAVILDDGDILISGNCGASTPLEFCAIRANPDGSLDTSFSGDGKNTWTINGIAMGDRSASALTLADGDVLLSGDCQTGGGNTQFCAVKVNPGDGSLDNTFSGDGKNTWSISGTWDEVIASVELTDGDVLLVGGCAGDMCAVRVNPGDGSLDNAFSGDGKNTWDVASGNDAAVDATLLGSDVFLSGACDNAGTTESCGLLVNLDGTLDNSFSGDGKALWSILGLGDEASNVLALFDGDLLLTGGCDTGGDTDMCAIRVNPDGGLDTSFSGDGKANWDFAGNDEWAMWSTLRSDGRVVIGGYCVNGADREFCAAMVDAPAGASVDNYLDNGTADWDTAGSIDLFGACLRSVANGATGGGSGWTVDGNNDCTASDADPWNAIPAAAPGSKIAAMTTPDAQGGATDPTVNIRFGFRAKADQAPGTYLAPIVFETIAPDVP